MAKSGGLSAEMLGALKVAGIEPSTTRRVVIDIPAGGMPIVHIEQFGDVHHLDIVRALTGIEIRKVADDG